MKKRILMAINTNIVIFQIIILSLLIVNSNLHLPALPEIRQTYNISTPTIQIAFIINPFIAMLVSLIYGAAIDFYGRKYVLLCSLSLFIFGTLLIIITSTFPLFFLGRIFQSLGDAGAAVACGVIIGDYYKGSNYGKIQAILSVALALAWAGSPLLGAEIFALTGWKGNFVLIFILTSVIIIPLFFWKEKNKLFNPHKGIIPDLIEIKKTIFSKLNTAFILFACVQALPLGIFTALEFIIPFIYRENYGHSIQHISFSFFIFISFNILSSVLYSHIINYLHLKKVIQIGASIFALYFLIGLFFLTLKHTSSEIYIYLIFGLLSFSLPFLLISSSTKIVDSYSQDLGIAISLLAIIRNAGTTLIPLFACMYSQNTFSSFFNITLIPTILTIGLTFKIIKTKYNKSRKL